MGTGSTLACVGARPLGMGGAFIGLANDLNSIYWNPAGLSYLPRLEATYTRTLNKRLQVNYNDYLAIGGPWQTDTWQGGWGFSYIDARLKDSITEHTFIDQWFNLGFALELTSDLSAGLNLRYYAGNQRDSNNSSYAKAGAWEGDLAFHLNSLYPLQIGILFQNVNQPRVHFPDFPGLNYKINLNIRPGLAYHLSPRSLISADIYDLTGKAGEGPFLNLGWENQLNDFLCCRAGFFKKNLTLGLSLEGRNNRYDYTFIAGEYNVHFLGFTHRF